MLYHSTQALQNWIGGHGGIYVAVDKDVQPNPLLAGIPERDVVTPSGLHLTLYNPPALLRHVMMEFEAESGSRVRIISQNPINSANTPDAWERAAFGHLTTKSDQFAELTAINGQPVYRLMRPIIQQEACLSCHQYDKSAEGSMIGAVSISLDARPDFAVHRRAEQSLLLSHVSMWMIGTLGIIVAGWRWRLMLLKLEQSAVCDALTGLYNRRELMNRLEVEAATAKRYGTALALVMLDIDYFKQVNDNHGHQAGDDVLRALAQIMRNSLRVSDLPARYGGEEFAILCPHTGIDGAMDIAERIRRTLEQTPLTTRGGEVCMTLSAGVAGYRQQLSVEDLIKEADQALYEAKHNGRNRVCLATPPV